MNRIRQAARRNVFPGAALFSMLLWIPGQATSAPPSPFTFATIGIYTLRGDPVVPEFEDSSTSAAVDGEVGTAPAAYAKVRAGFGSVGLAMQAAQADRSPAGGGLWSDGFTIDGGTGNASLTVGTRLTGTIIGQSELTYALFTSPTTFDLQIVIDEIEAGDFGENPQLPNATRLLYTNQETASGTVDLSLFGNLTFTYGQPFYLLAGFAGELTPGNSMDFFNSADFGITVPDGATLRSLSGTAYAAAVPEPGTLLLLAAGLAGIALRVKRSNAGEVSRDEEQT